MGRPLNKKYFGNRNIGGSGTGDDYGIGGEGVASVVLNALGAYTTRPTITFSAPQLPTGVTATGTITSEVESITAVGGTQTGYTVGQLITVTGTNAVLRVATIGGTGGDDALTFDFTGGSRGTFTTLTTGAQATTSNGAGAGLTVTLRFRAKAVVVTEAGSGYTSSPTASFTQSVTATSVTRTVTPADPITGSSTNQENAIQLTAFIPLESQAGWISGYSGSSAVAGDIARQSGNGKFIARTEQGVGRVKLVGYVGSNVTPAAGEAIITATDYDGGSYYVTKISDRRCNIIGYTGSGFTTGETGINVPWTFNGTSGTKVDASQPYLEDGVNVKINNA